MCPLDCFDVETHSTVFFFDGDVEGVSEGAVLAIAYAISTQKLYIVIESLQRHPNPF